MKLFGAYANANLSHVKNQYIAVICGKNQKILPVKVNIAKNRNENLLRYL